MYPRLLGDKGATSSGIPLGWIDRFGQLELAPLCVSNAAEGRTGVLPDFFIGAHAVIEGWPLLTRDAGRYRAYFPGIALIAPE